MHNRFAIIKLWENTVSAEDENIARIINAANSLGLECVPIDRYYRVIDNKEIIADEDQFDFVLHLHFDSVKINNLFSFVALWNPIQFYHDWGYRRFSDCILSHDDYLSCSSSGADRHLMRLIYSNPYKLPPEFKFYHSISSPIYRPEPRTDRKLFYCGINWERINNKKGRHGDLLKFLDSKGLIDIYGPEKLQNKKVWDGYQGYKSELPFDGVSVVEKIHDSGIGLVLSSQAHISAELMSNRLFECLAAGVPIICDQNSFARKFFGDLLYYINTDDSFDLQCKSIMEHIDTIRKNSETALQKADEAQKKFLDEFELSKSIHNIYLNIEQRKYRLRKISELNLSFESKLKICWLGGEEKNNIEYGILGNMNKHFEHYIYCSHDEKEKMCKNLENTNIKFIEKNSCNYSKDIYDFLKRIDKSDYFAIVLPNELILRNHFSKLINILKKNNKMCAYSQMLFNLSDKGTIVPYLIFGHNDIKTFGNFVFNGNILNNILIETMNDIRKMFIHILFLAANERVYVKEFSCISTDPDFHTIYDVNDIDIINDIFPDVYIHKRTVQANSYGFVHRRLMFLKKYPTVWKLLKKAKQIITMG